MKKTLRLIALIATLAMILTFAACDFFNRKGSLKLESFTIDRSSIKTSYTVGEEIDLSGIKAIAKYSDETLNKTYTFSELTISDITDITAEAGTKEITVSFKDPHLDVEQKATILITVTDGANIEPGDELSIAVQFEKPESLNSFDSANNVNTALKPEDSGFAGEFAVGGKTYIIGNENEFRLTPAFSVLGEDDVVKSLENFHSIVEVAVEKEGAYVALTSQAGEGTQVSYYDGETLIVTVDTYKGLYNFSADAEGLKVKISVLPSEAHYIFEKLNPVVLEAKIIKAYNIYEAWQLAVVDNSNAEWADFKTAHGIADVTASGIVLHNDITLTADDVPASFFYISEKDVVYTDTSANKEDANAEVKTNTIPAGTKFLKDSTFVYKRDGVADFVIEGNFFTLDTKAFPLVASHAVFGKDSDKGYGSDFSNASLFKFDSVDWDTVVSGTVPTDVADVTVNNISLIGNAARNFFVDNEGGLASAGGLIFLKSSHYTNTKMNNLIGNSYFITYFVDYGASMYVSNSKCYDSYQNAAFVWGNSKLEMVDTYINGCGGPVIIAQSVMDEDAHPIVTVTGGKLETHLGGGEIWFTAVNANAIVAQITGLGAKLHANGLGNFVDASGKMNIVGAIMASGSNAAEIVTGINAQGSIFVDGVGMDRFQTAENVQWAYIKGITDGAISAGSNALPPFLTVYANGTAYTLYSDGTDLYDLTTGAKFDPQGNAEHAAIYFAFTQADKIILTQGGLSVVFEFYHY